MRLVIWLIILFALATGLSLLVQVNQGYALLFLPPWWEIKLSLNAFILSFVGLVVGAYALVRGLDWVIALPIKVRRYHEHRRVNRARNQRTAALLAMLEGRYLLAERALRQTLDAEDDRDARLVDHLIGAQIAQQSRDFNSRDRYLEEARQASNGDCLALAMVEAEMWFGQYHYREALEAVERALAISPKLTAALKLELKIRQHENHPARIIEIVDQLERNDALEAPQAARIRAKARIAQLELEPMDSRELSRWWGSLSTAERWNSTLACAAARAFARAGDDTHAETLLVGALEQQWDSRLIEAYGELGKQNSREDEAIKRLARAEAWLPRHPNDHVLLLALGRLCSVAALWGKARTYLEASVAVHATPIALAELGQLLEQLGSIEEAAAVYRRSLGLALDALEAQN